MDVNGYAMKGVKTFNTPDGGGYTTRQDQLSRSDDEIEL